MEGPGGRPRSSPGEVVHAAAAYKIGASRTHALFGVGTRFTGDERLVPFLGFGVHNPIGNGFLDVDLLSHALLEDVGQRTDGPPTLHTLRVVYGWRFAPHFAVFAGPTWNTLLAKPADGIPDLGFTPTLSNGDADLRVLQWPGAVLGVEI